MSHQGSGPKNYVHKDLHNQVVNELKGKLEKSISVVRMAKEYIFSRRRKRNRGDDDMCFVMSASLSELEETSPVEVTFKESDKDRLERFTMSITQVEYERLREEWELHKEAHNGFDCWLAHELIRLRTDSLVDFKNKALDEKYYRQLLRTIAGMAGNPDAVEGCRLIVKRINKVLDGR